MKKIIIILCVLYCLFAFTSCSNSKNNNENDHEHSYTSSVIAPTCDKDGYTLYICSICNHQYSDEAIKALGHAYKESIQDANCNQHQKKVFKCSNCKSSYSEELEALGSIHKYISEVTYPNAERGGYTTHTCKNCQISYVDSYTEPVSYSMGLEYKKISNRYYVSGVGDCQDTDIIIPEVSEQGYIIVGINENAFQNSNVVSVTVPDSVTDIKQFAFFNCEALETVVLGKNANLASNVFVNTPSLKKLTLPMKNSLAYYFKDLNTSSEKFKQVIHNISNSSSKNYGSIPYSLEEINLLSAPCDYAFQNCDMLKKVTISPSSTSIGAAAFKNCTGITEINIPSTVTSIGAYAFEATSISSIVIPDKVVLTYDNQYIFYNCSNLTDVKLPKALAIIPDYTFTNCKKLSKLEIPNTVTYLGVIFISGTSIEAINLPNSIDTIHANAFNGCTSLKQITLPTSLKNIDYNAFENCTSLEAIEIPSTLQKIGNEAFKGCALLKSIELPNSLTNFGNSIFENCTSLSNVKLAEASTAISGGLFKGCLSLTSIEIPNTVSSIYGSAFSGSGIVSITIPQNVTYMGSHVFASCKSLKSVTFLSDNTPISNYMFYDASALETITIPKSAQNIPVAFCLGATSLHTINFNEGLIVIYEEAFADCTSLKEITMPTTLRNIHGKAFKNCTNLTTVDFSNIYISAENTSNAKECFANCTSLTEIKNFDNVNCINETFFVNTPLHTVENGMTISAGWLIKVNPAEIPTILEVPNKVTKISDYAFSACTHIEEVTLPEGLTYIGTRIFGTNENSALKKLTLPDSLTSFSSDTIYFLTNIQELVVGKELKIFNDYSLGELSVIRFRGTIEEFYEMPWCNNNNILKITIICTDATIEPRA